MESPKALLQEKDYAAVCVCAGLQRDRSAGFKGEEGCLTALELLWSPARFAMEGQHVVIVGGGAVSVDCATTARRAGARRIVSAPRGRGDSRRCPGPEESVAPGLPAARFTDPLPTRVL